MKYVMTRKEYKTDFPPEPVVVTEEEEKRYKLTGDLILAGNQLRQETDAERYDEMYSRFMKCLRRITNAGGEVINGVVIWPLELPIL
jgi:hypothetical protein